MTTRKNVLILGHNYEMPFVDVNNQYVKLFDKEHYKVTVIYLSGQPNQQIEERTLAEEVIFLANSKTSIRGLKISSIKNLLKLCRERKFSIVICHRYKPIYTMLWIAQFCRIPSLFFVMHTLRTFKQIKRKILLATLMRKNMYLAGVSNAVRNDLQRDTWLIPKKNVITLYNCIDIEETEKQMLTRDEARKYLGLSSDDAFVFGIVARLVPEKEHKSVIQAFAKIVMEHPRSKLIIIGNGRMEDELKNLAHQLQLTDSVIFTGFAPEAFRLMKAFDLFVLPSSKEAFGRVFLEAMLAKTPVIGARVDGIPEVIADAGVMVEAQNTEMLGAAMQRFICSTKEELAAWGERGYQHVKDNFSIEQFKKMFWYYF